MAGAAPLPLTAVVPKWEPWEGSAPCPGLTWSVSSPGRCTLNSGTSEGLQTSQEQPLPRRPSCYPAPSAAVLLKALLQAAEGLGVKTMLQRLQALALVQLLGEGADGSPEPASLGVPHECLLTG